MYQVCPSSPQMLAHIVAGTESPPITLKYPFHDLGVGCSFLVPIAEANEKSLRTLASQEGRRRGMVFKVMRHNDHGIIEVGRIL